MLQLEILTGRNAGKKIATAKFPFRVGRGPGSDLSLQEEGVWEEHLEITLQPPDGFFVIARSQAAILINGDAAPTAKLRNGDILTVGAVQLRFGLQPPRQKSLRVREIFTWSCLALIGLVQVALIYWLLG